MIDRRTFLRLGALSVAGLATYSMVIEPGFFLDVTRYRLTPAGWPEGLRLRLAILTDLHACEPWMPFSRIRAIARAVNDLSPDLVALLGDYSAGTQFVTAATPPQQWAEGLGESFLPVRFRRPPEIVEVILEAPAQIARADL